MAGLIIIKIDVDRFQSKAVPGPGSEWNRLLAIAGSGLPESAPGLAAGGKVRRHGPVLGLQIFQAAIIP
jgi:hypothetical protein